MMRRLARRWRRIVYRGGHRRHPRQHPGNHILTQLPRTPPPPPLDLGPWAPRIARWVRVTHPCPDDTIISGPLWPPVPAAAVLEQMRRSFTWAPQ